MKKVQILLLVFPLLFLCSCGRSDQALQQSPPEKTLTVAIDDYAPYSYLDENGRFSGIDVALAREACARIGYAPSFVLVIWNEKDSYLEKGEVDCIWSCLSMNGREDLYQWVGPYLQSRQVYVVSAASDIYLPSELDGKTAAVHSGTKPEQLFLEQKTGTPAFKTVYSFSSIENMFAALRKDYVDACATHEAIVRNYMEQHNTAFFRILDQEIYHANLGIAFSKANNDAPLAELKEALCEMDQDGTTAAILQSYGIDPENALIGEAE